MTVPHKECGSCWDHCCFVIEIFLLHFEKFLNYNTNSFNSPNFALFSLQRDDVWSSAPWGLGGNGRGSCVHSGPFKGGKFRLTPSAREGCLRRNFNGKFEGLCSYSMRFQRIIFG